MVPQKVFDNLVIFWKTGNGEFKIFFTPKGLHSTAQGRAAHPGIPVSFPPLPRRGLYNPFGVEGVFLTVVPGVRCATLGCGVQPLRGKKHGKAFVKYLLLTHLEVFTGYRIKNSLRFCSKSRTGGERSPASPRSRASGSRRSPASPRSRASGSRRSPASPRSRASGSRRSPASPRSRASGSRRSPASPRSRASGSRRSPASPRSRASGRSFWNRL